MNDENTVTEGRSTGPKSEAGKLRSSQNALKHGGYSHKVVLVNEDQSAFDALLARYLAEWQPVNQTETDLVTQMAINYWKFLRYTGCETAIIDTEMFIQRPGFEAAFTDTTAEMRQSDAILKITHANVGLETISRFANRASRAYEKALRLLVWHRKQRGAPPAPEPAAVTAPLLLGSGQQTPQSQPDTQNHRNELPAGTPPPETTSQPAVLTGTVPEIEVFRFETAFTPNASRPTGQRKDWVHPDYADA